MTQMKLKDMTSAGLRAVLDYINIRIDTVNDANDRNGDTCMHQTGAALMLLEVLHREKRIVETALAEKEEAAAARQEQDQEAGA